MVEGRRRSRGSDGKVVVDAENGHLDLLGKMVGGEEDVGAGERCGHNVRLIVLAYTRFLCSGLKIHYDHMQIL